MDTTKKISFDKNNSLALKGIAILMMMMHHCFLSPDRYEGYSISFAPFNEYQINNLSYYLKMCVPIFAFISGYGLYLNYKRKKTTPGLWTLSRAIKMMSGYYIIWIIAAIWAQVGFEMVDKRFFKNTNDIYTSITKLLVDFMGLSKMFRTSTLNGTWWYMSAALFFVLITPIIMKADEMLPLILLAICAVPRVLKTGYSGDAEVLLFIPIYVMGMCVAKYNLLNRWYGVWSSGKKRAAKFFIELIVMCVLYKAYIFLSQKTYLEIRWVLIPVVVIAFCSEFINTIPMVKNVLMFLGKHSMNIFMVHTFIRNYFYKDYTYGFKYFWLIVLMLLLTSLGVSIVLEFIKKRIHYDEFFAKICKRIEACGQQ